MAMCLPRCIVDVPQKGMSVDVKPRSVHGCRQASEVRVSIHSMGTKASRPMCRRILALVEAQKHWLLPCAEGLLGFHVLQDYCAAAEDAMHMSASEWLTALR